MKLFKTKEIAQQIYDIFSDIVVNLDEKTRIYLEKTKEERPLAQFALDILVENAKLASQSKLPICQDTGMAIIFLEIGQEVCLEGNLLDYEINVAIERCYKDNNFRLSVLDPITRENTKTNTPAIIHTEIVSGDKIKIYAMSKGFGSENMSKLYMLKPSDGILGIENAILDCAKQAGSNACPPMILGVCIGGSADSAMTQAKKQLFRDLDDINKDEFLANFENQMLKKVNSLQIGVSGFGGSNTALRVFCTKMPTHLAALPVAVCVQCNCNRKKIVELS